MRKFFLVFFLVFLTGSLAYANPAYDEMIESINRWLQSNEQYEFHSATEQEAFMWRLEIEKIESLGHGRDKANFERVRKLIDDIGDKSFTYQGKVYNKESLQALLLRYYPSYTYGDPLGFLLEQYEWFKVGVTEKRKQVYWLMEYLNYIGWLSRDGNAVNSLTGEYRYMVNEILSQVMAFAEDKEVYDYGFVYTDYIMIWVDVENYLINYLNKIDRFLGYWAEFMTDDEKELMLNWLIPTFAEYDVSVRIYHKLTK